ncbi:hypothetical protein KUCAC02_035742 [Chaenocephalus aceratus]|nr:hypothetical protein KUCAC02_035742 [Chaenocephalus aceratus]
MDDLAQGVPPRGDVLVSAESAGRQHRRRTHWMRRQHRRCKGSICPLMHLRRYGVERPEPLRHSGNTAVRMNLGGKSEDLREGFP